MVIYRTTNLVNGKYYIGKQKKYTDRYLGSGIALKFAIKKYGKENFKKEILEVCNTEDELQNKELEWLDKLNAVKNKQCYNLVRETSPNIHRSYNDVEYRKKLSQSVKIAMNRPEVHAKIVCNNSGKNNPMYGKTRTDDFKKMVSQIHKGKQLSGQTKDRISKSHIGIKATGETREKMRKSQLKRWNTIRIEVNWEKRRVFDNRASFMKFIHKYNQEIPIGRVHGESPKRINWKRALRGEYAFIKIIQK